MHKFSIVQKIDMRQKVESAAKTAFNFFTFNPPLYICVKK